MAKDRSYANPIIVKLVFNDREGPLKAFEVAEYQVTDKHVILTRKVGDSKITKYVSISALKTFEFDAPMDYVPKQQAATLPPAMAFPWTTVQAGSQTPPDASPIYTPNPIVARNRPVAVRPTPDVPVASSEKNVIEGAMKGREIGGMS